MLKTTSAYANKMLRQLNEDKDFWVNKERQCCLYTAAVGETPVIPEYDYAEVTATIEAIDEKICRIKHAIHLENATGMVEVGDKMYSIDRILIRMAQLNQRKVFLDSLRKQQPKTRVEQHAYGTRSVTPEYQYINYDLDLIKQEYERISLEIMEMQMALDKYNQTHEFEVDI